MMTQAVRGTAESRANTEAWSSGAEWNAELRRKGLVVRFVSLNEPNDTNRPNFHATDRISTAHENRARHGF
jgi:hypothetical protein